MDNQAKGQAVGNAAKIAADLTVIALNGATVPDTDTLVALFNDIHAKVATSMIALNESLETPAPAAPAPVQSAAPVAAFNPQAAVQSAFPGSTLVQAPPSATVAAPVQAPAPAAIPNAAVPGGGDPAVAEAWEVFFQDVNNKTFEANWHDNRTSKRSDRSPDFRHKTWKRSPSDRYTVGLYIKSEKNPAGLAERLAGVGVS